MFTTEVTAAVERSGTALPCWTADPDLFFSEDGTAIDRAKALCAACPVALACLAGALTRDEAYGVWGGQLVVDGVVVTERQPKGRPSKAWIAGAGDRAERAAAATDAALAWAATHGLVGTTEQFTTAA